jgi:hypothetical protein
MPSCKYPSPSEKGRWYITPVWFFLRVVLVLNLILPADFSSSGKSYPELFGADWDKACCFVKENEDWMKRNCRIFRADYALAVSVVFPELVRYSVLRDKIEITLLKALYTHKGAEYSDFSVGVFQMKPSCAEDLLEEFSATTDIKFHRFFDRLHGSVTGREKRVMILKEMEDPEVQFIYVLGMIRLMDKKYGKKTWKDVEEKVRFYATAYNSGFNNTENRITENMNATYFHTGLGKPPVCHSYAAISAAFYHSLASNINP